MAWDIHQDFDACDPQGFPDGGDVRFHLGAPALLAAEALCRRSPRSVAVARRLSDFLARYGQFIRNCAGALKRGGKLAILMGDYSTTARPDSCRWSTTPSGLPSPPD